MSAKLMSESNPRRRSYFIQLTMTLRSRVRPKRQKRDK